MFYTILWNHHFSGEGSIFFDFVGHPSPRIYILTNLLYTNITWIHMKRVINQINNTRNYVWGPQINKLWLYTLHEHIDRNELKDKLLSFLTFCFCFTHVHQLEDCQTKHKKVHAIVILSWIHSKDWRLHGFVTFIF